MKNSGISEIRDFSTRILGVKNLDFFLKWIFFRWKVVFRKFLKCSEGPICASRGYPAPTIEHIFYIFLYIPIKNPLSAEYLRILFGFPAPTKILSSLAPLEKSGQKIFGDF